MHRAFTLAAACLVIVAVGACSRPAAGSPSPVAMASVATPAVTPAQTSTPWPTLPPEATRPPIPEGLDNETTSWILQRQGMGLRSDLEWVLAVAKDPRADDRTLEMPALPEEAEAFLTWQDEYNRLIRLLVDDSMRHPDTFGGIFVDTPNHRVVTLWSDDLEEHAARTRALVGDDAPVELYRVTYPEAVLRELQDRVPLDTPFYAEAEADPTGVGVDIKRNVLSVDVSSANPDAPTVVAALLADYLDVPVEMIRVDSDGTGVNLMARGVVRGTVYLADGTRLRGESNLELRWEGDGPGECGGGDVGYGVDSHGVFEIGCTVGGWTIVIDDEDTEIGRVHATVVADQTTKVKVTLSADYTPDS